MARIRLLHAEYSHEASWVDQETQQHLYKRVAKADSSWEDGYYRIAKYYDDLFLYPKIDFKQVKVSWELLLSFIVPYLRSHSHLGRS